MNARRVLFLLLAAALISVSCGSDTASSSEPVSVEPVCRDSVSAFEAGELGDLAPQDEAAAEAEVTKVSTFDVGGATVLTRTNLESLPDKACVVRFTSFVTDSGDGLKLCLGAYETSGGSTCPGPVIEDLNTDGSNEAALDLTPGLRTVTVVWAPEDGRLPGLANKPQTTRFPGPISGRTEFGLPEECRDANAITDWQTLTRFANDNPDRVGGAWLGDGRSKVVLAVVEEYLEEVRAELSTADAEPCLVPVQYSRTQLHAANDRLFADDQQPGYSPIRGYDVREVNNRVEVRVDVADRNTAQFIVDLVDEPDLLQIVGTAEILGGVQAPMDPVLVERSETPVPEGLRPATTMPPP